MQRALASNSGQTSPIEHNFLFKPEFLFRNEWKTYCIFKIENAKTCDVANFIIKLKVAFALKSLFKNAEINNLRGQNCCLHECNISIDKRKRQ